MTSPRKSEPELEENKPSPAKSPRLSYWPSKKRQANAETPKVDVPAKKLPVDCKVAELSEGYYNRKTLEFRVTFVSKNQLGKNFYFRAADNSGERIFKAFESERPLCSEIEFNQVFMLNGFQVQPPRNERVYEIALTRFSKITKIPESNDYSIPFSRLDLSKLASLDRQQVADVMGVVLERTEGSSNIRLIITDETKEEAYVNIWNEDPSSRAEVGDVVLLRHVKKGYDIDGMCSLNANFLSHVWLNPDREDAVTLREWFNKASKEEGTELPSNQSKDQ